MSDRLEEFVKNNKKEFEVKGPSDQLWAKIAADLDKKQPKKSIKMYQWLSIAAMLVISLGIYFNYNYSNKPSGNIDVADVNPALGKKEVRFSSLIEEKKDSLAIYGKQNPELYKKFVADLSKLDADYENLKKQLQNTPNRQTVGKAMMKNLELQYQVISQQLNIINQVNQYKKENSI